MDLIDLSRLRCELTVLHDIEAGQIANVRPADDVRPGVWHQGHSAKLGDDVLSPKRLGEDADIEIADPQINRLRLWQHGNPVGDIPGGVAEGGKGLGEAFLHETDPPQHPFANEVEHCVDDEEECEAVNW